MTSNTNKVVNNSFWNISNTFLTFLTGLILSVFIARFLGPENTGVYNYFIWLINILILITGLGGGTTIVKYVAEFLSRNELGETSYFLRKLFLFQFLLAVILCSVILGINNLFGIFATGISNYFFIALLTLFPYLWITSSLSILQGSQRYKTIAKISILVNALMICSIFVVLMLNGSVFSLLLTHLAVYLVSSVIYFFITKKYFPKTSEKLSSTKSKEILSYGGSIYLITILDAVVWQKSEILFLGFFSHASEIAFYSIAYGLANMVILVIANSFNSVLVPIFSQLKVRGENLKIQTGYFRTTKLLSIIMIPIAAGLFILSPAIISTVYGPSYLASSLIFSILIIPITLAAIAGSGSALIYSLNKQWFIIRWGIPLAILNITLDFLLIPSYGGIGAASANAITQILGLSIGTFYIIRHLKMPFPTPAFFKALTASSIMVIFLILLSSLNLNVFAYLSLSIIFGAVIYLVTIVNLKTLDKNDFLMLKSIDNKFIKSKLFLKALNFLESKI